ncbi:hypothetical protein Pan54_11070 [Rubinisphaera italica]|uniref:DUF1573 domain-containing protein n=2 Tax=Rubinisphaera italica TaxID=2527969 RepID=A0A5C5XDL0_9PLAN|nr:hypothetical protein Pan54_11070 [Rubinisphaera italica]
MFNRLKMIQTSHTGSSVIVCIMGLLFLVSSGCEEKIEVAEPKKEIQIDLTGPQPKVVLEEPLYEFGNMEVGETLRHDFVIHNDGEGTLTLVKDRSTCKCTMADFEERDVPPGESTTITLEWIGKAEDPNFSQAAYIKTNDNTAKEIALTVAGRVDKTFEITPAGIWNLGELNRDKPTSFSGKITSRVLDDFVFKDSETSNPLVSVKVIPMTPEQLKEDDVKAGYLIQGEVQPNSSIGEFEASVTLKGMAKGEEQSGFFSINGFYSGPIQIVGPAGWKATEMLLVMGRMEKEEGKTVNLSMFLRDNENGPVEVLDVKAEPDFFTFEMTKDENFKAENRERYKMKISVKPDSPPLNFDRDNPARLEVTTNNPLIGKMNFKIHILSY